MVPVLGTPTGDACTSPAPRDTIICFAYTGAGQAWKAEMLYVLAGVDRDSMPRTLVKAPRQWVCRWRGRWGAALRVAGRVSELTNEIVVDRVEAFWAYCKYISLTTPDAVWVNFDETPLWFSFHSGRTNVPRKRLAGKQPVRLFGKGSRSRRRITVGLTISTDVDFAKSVPVFAIFKGDVDRQPSRSDSEWAGVEIPDGVVAHWQPSAWMTEELLGDWIGLLIQARDQMYGPGRVVVLVWDSFRAHLTEAIRIMCAEHAIRLVVIPRALTALLQGLDTHVNKAFKAACRAWWRRYMFESSNPRCGALGMQSFLRLIQNAAAEALSLPVAEGRLVGMTCGEASFLQSGLTNAADGSEDGLITVRHEAVTPARRRELVPASPETAAAAIADQAMDALEEEDGAGDPPMSDGGESDSEEASAEGAGAVMRRLSVARDAWIDSLASVAGGSDAPPVRGVVREPGHWRSTRRIRPAKPKQDRCTGSAARAGGGGARGSQG